MKRNNSAAVNFSQDYFSRYSDHTRLVSEILLCRAEGRSDQRLVGELMRQLDPLLLKAAHRLHRVRGSVAVDDLMQLGRLEVFKAIETFNALRTQSFATLVWWTARGAMLEHCQGHSADVRPSHGAQRGRVKKVGITATTVDNDAETVAAMEDAAPLADEVLASWELRQLVRQCLKRLPRHMADLVARVHGLGVEAMSVRDIARTTGQNRARLSAELKRGESLLGVMVARATR